MPEAYSIGLRERACELYVVDGLTQEQVAKELGVSVQAVRKWSSQEGWKDQRREYLRARLQIRRDAVKLQRELLQRALETLDPQLVYAAARLLAATKGKALEKPEAPEEARQGKEALDEETKKLIREEIYGL